MLMNIFENMFFAEEHWLKIWIPRPFYIPRKSGSRKWRALADLRHGSPFFLILRKTMSFTNFSHLITKIETKQETFTQWFLLFLEDVCCLSSRLNVWDTESLRTPTLNEERWTYDKNSDEEMFEEFLTGDAYQRLANHRLPFGTNPYDQTLELRWRCQALRSGDMLAPSVWKLSVVFDVCMTCAPTHGCTTFRKFWDLIKMEDRRTLERSTSFNATCSISIS